MCEIVDSETYLLCGHKVPCHLKYGFHYCHAPNGVPFKNPETYESDCFYPTRFCKEETWGSRTMQIERRCKECRIKRRMTGKEDSKERVLPGEEGREGEGEEDGEEEISSSDFDSDSDEESDADGEKEDLAGEVVTFTECPCSLVSYDPKKLQGCFEKKPPLSQMIARARRASDYAAQSFSSSVGTGLPVRTRSIYRTPTPPTMDWKLIKAHRAADDEDFSMARRNQLTCSRRIYPTSCANCARKEVVEEVDKMGRFHVQEEGFRRRKPKGLWVVPGTEKTAKRVVAVRGEVQS